MVIIYFLPALMTYEVLVTMSLIFSLDSKLPCYLILSQMK